MLNFKFTNAAVFTVLAIAGFAGRAKADTYAHLDRLAVDIMTKADLMVREGRAYRFTPEYRHLMADLRDIRALADHVHDVAHYRGSIHHLDRDVRMLDRKFHHVEDLVRDIEHHAIAHGQVLCTRQFRRLMRDMENCIHHMADDVQTLKRLIQRQRQRSTCPNTRYYNNYGGYHYGNYNRSYSNPPRNQHSGRSYHSKQRNFGHSKQHGVHHSANRGGVTIGNGKVRFNIKF